MIAGVHTHQLADHVGARGTDMEQSRWPSGDDKKAAKNLGRPEVVVSRSRVTMTWWGANGREYSATILSFGGVDALRRGEGNVHVPKRLRTPE